MKYISVCKSLCDSSGHGLVAVDDNNRESVCNTSISVTLSGEVEPKCRRQEEHKNKGLFVNFKTDWILQSQDKDTKQKPKYTKPNKTQVEIIKLTRTETTQ